MNKSFELKNLKKEYVDGSGKNILIIKEVNISLHNDQSIGIVGVSGSGKSTLLHILGGLDQMTEGEVLYEGENIYQFTSHRIANWRNKEIGFVFQFHQLLPDFNALENVMMPALIAGMSKEVAKEKSYELLKHVAIEHRKDHKPSQLSGGEQQRVAIARALINSPKYILADEPTGNLDKTTGLNVFDLLQRICCENGATLVMVTHDQTIAKKLGKIWEISNHLLYLR